MTEDRIGRRNSAMTRQYKVQAAAHAVPGNCGIHRCRELFDGGHELLPESGKFISSRTRERRNLLQVCSYRKESTISGNDQAICLLPHFTESIDQRNHTASSQPIGTIVGL